MKRFLHIGLSTLPNSHSAEMRQAFYKQGWQCEDIAVQYPNLNGEIIRVANEFKPDLCFIQIQDRGITKEAIQALKQNGAFILNWCGDIRHTLPQCYLEYAAMGVDLTCFSNMRDIEIMRMYRFKTDWLQIGYSTQIYSPNGLVINQAEIVFMGNCFNHFPLSIMRKDMVNELKKVYGNRFKAFGSGQPDGSYMGNQLDEAAVYRGAKIGINLSHFDSERYTSDRMFRMLGTGICVLSHNYKGFEKDFNINQVNFWRDLNDLKECINYLLIHENERQAIAKAGHELALNKFTFEKMGENIIELYNKYNQS